MPSKEKLTQEVRRHIAHTQERIEYTIQTIRNRLDTPPGEQSEIEDVRMLEGAFSSYYEDYLEQLHKLHPAPYFSRLDVVLEHEHKQLYIGKFNAEEAGIISWTTPVAALRFDDPGLVSYSTGEETISGRLDRKDQYMIVNGDLTFFSQETAASGRQLIYQEYLSQQNRGFALPEIVAQMEKAQDHVIRAEPRGSLAITGPAGSGKTTLALHRVAFLTQSPDTTKKYPGHRLLVLVQDQSTQSYFNSLLPQLGIHNVTITTFADWAQTILNLGEYSFHSYTSWGDLEQHSLEQAKIMAIRNHPIEKYRKKQVSGFLKKIYTNFLSTEHLKIVSTQLDKQILDRYDLTLLLAGYNKTNPGFSQEKIFSFRRKNGTMATEKRQVPLHYPLIVIDEFQNYLPEQLHLISSCISPQTGSTLYVGDTAQQTHFGSSTNWEQLDSTLADNRCITMGKVYRNTSQILTYIQKRGYEVEIPEGIKSGPDVRELSLSPTSCYNLALHYLEENPESRVGIISLHEDGLTPLQNNSHAAIHLMTVRQAQGVEFDLVIFLEMSQSAGLDKESKRIEQDLVYVGLTRAIRELVVVTLLL